MADLYMAGNTTDFVHSSLHLSLKILVMTMELSWLTLVSFTQAECFVALGILGLWIFGLRPLPSRYNKIKHYISVTSWKEACKLQFTMMTWETLHFTCAEVCTLYSSLLDSGHLGLRPHLETWTVLSCVSYMQASNTVKSKLHCV